MQEMQADVNLIPRSGRFPGGGLGNPLQYSCLENPMDRTAWRVLVHRIIKSQTQLKWLSTQACTDCHLPGSSIHGIFQARVLKWSEVAQSCPALCDPMDCSLPGSSIHGIFQARVLEWVAISFSRGTSRLRDRTLVSRIVGRCFTVWTIREAPKNTEVACISSSRGSSWPRDRTYISCIGRRILYHWASIINNLGMITYIPMNIHWKEGLMLKQNLQYLTTWCEDLTHWKRPMMLGKIEGRRRRGQQRMRW